jgi:hypothetical protein
VKPVALASGVPSVKVSGPAGLSNTEEKTLGLAKELDKPKSSPAAVGHSVDKPAATVPVSAPVRSNADKPAPVNPNAPPRVSSHKPASNSHANAPVHSSSPSSHSAQKDAPRPVSVPAQNSPVNSGNVNSNNNRQPLAAH